MRTSLNSKEEPVTEETISKDSSEMSPLFVRFKGVLAALAYGVTSMSMILVNKTILTPYSFHSPPFMAFVHMLCSLSFLVVLKHFKVVHYADFTKKNFSKLWGVSIVFVLNIVFGMWALQNVQVPIFTTLRRLTALLTIVLGYYYDGQIPTFKTVFCVFIMLSGAVIAGWGDLTFDLFGYVATIINDIFTAGYLVASKKALSAIQRVDRPDDAGENPQQVNKLDVLFYNTTVAIPVLFVWCIQKGTFQSIVQFEHLWDWKFQLAFLFSALMAFFINFTILWCNEMNSPLTTSVTGQTKNILVTLIGGVIFADTEPTKLLVLGVTISIIGSTLYAAEKYQVKKRLESEKLKREKGDDQETVQLVINGQANPAS